MAAGSNTDSIIQSIEEKLKNGNFYSPCLNEIRLFRSSNPTDGRAHLYALMYELRCRTRKELAAQREPFDGNENYLKAMQYGDSELKNELQGYINAINARIEANLKNPKVGDEVFLGTNNGQRMWWKVLKIQDGTALVIAADDRFTIFNMTYHQSGGNITWSECALRKWLNSDFINEYFTKAERARILPCKLNNDDNPKYNTPGGVPTTDRVFLLSIEEANTLFANGRARDINYNWWLRTPGSSPDSVACVNRGGKVSPKGIIVNERALCVRPAFYVQCGTPQETESPSGTTIVNDTNSDSLLQSVEIMLGEGDFYGAMYKCDVILDMNPTNARVYFYMLMSNLCCRTRNDLAAQKVPFDGNQYYLKAMQYGDSELKKELQGYINAINARSEAKQKNPKVGDEIYFGTNANNGQRMWWKVLKTQDRTALVITNDFICFKPYHQPGGDTTWSECTLRKWLNSDFINGYFTQAERERILPCELNNNGNHYKTLGEYTTTDEVFLLSVSEATTLFTNDQERANGTWWWLRSTGRYADDLGAYVDYAGEVDSSGYNASVNIFQGVRPALWLNLDS